MKWFKHISDSLDDPFIYDLIEEFGPLGYLVFFGTIEVYSREFKPEKNWFLSISIQLLCRKLQIKQQKTLKTVLNYIKKNNNWEINFCEKKVDIFMPNFLKFLDESTMKKLREKLKEIQNKSGIIPEQFLPTDKDADADVDILTASLHFSQKVGEYFEPIKLACELISSLPAKNGFNPYKFVQQHTNKHKHPASILDALNGMVKKWRSIDNPYGYGVKVINTKSGNYNEQEHIAASQEFKKVFFENADIKELIGGVTKRI